MMNAGSETQASFILHPSSFIVQKVSRRRLLPVSPTTENRRTAGQFNCRSPNRAMPNRKIRSSKIEIRNRSRPAFVRISDLALRLYVRPLVRPATMLMERRSGGMS